MAEAATQPSSHEGVSRWAHTQRIQNTEDKWRNARKKDSYILLELGYKLALPYGKLLRSWEEAKLSGSYYETQSILTGQEPWQRPVSCQLLCLPVDKKTKAQGKRDGEAEGKAQPGTPWHLPTFKTPMQWANAVSEELYDAGGHHSIALQPGVMSLLAASRERNTGLD